MLTMSDSKCIIVIPECLDPDILDTFYSDLDRIANSQIKQIRVDCSNITEVSGRNLVIIWQLYDRLRAVGVDIEFKSVPQKLEHILKRHVFNGSNARHVYEAESTRQREALAPDSSQKMIELSFRPTRDEIDNTVNLLKDFLHDKRVIDLEVFELMTVFYEAATNIRLHADLNPDSWIDFTALVSGENVFMRIEDRGIAFDPTLMLKTFDPTQAMKSRKKRGLGIILMARLVDSMTYLRSMDGKNILYLNKSLTRGEKKYVVASSYK